MNRRLGGRHEEPDDSSRRLGGGRPRPPAGDPPGPIGRGADTERLIARLLGPAAKTFLPKNGVDPLLGPGAGGRRLDDADPHGTTVHGTALDPLDTADWDALVELLKDWNCPCLRDAVERSLFGRDTVCAYMATTGGGAIHGHANGVAYYIEQDFLDDCENPGCIAAQADGGATGCAARANYAPGRRRLEEIPYDERLRPRYDNASRVSAPGRRADGCSCAIL